MIIPRVGFGYDSHRFVPKSEYPEGKLIICGVSIPNEMVFLAHSDGDLAVHALVDALLGAAGIGNIGTLFPDTSLEYKGTDSMWFLKETIKILKTRNFQVFNVDITIVLEKPKIAEYIEQMRENISGVLEIGRDFVSVKGKTNEKMDAVGAGAGAVAFAVASVLQDVEFK